MASAPAQEDLGTKITDAIVAGYRLQPRSPLLKDPSSQGLSFEALSFPSEDGVPLEAWFIPCEGSDKLIVTNHPRYFSRYGFPSHLEPWRSMFLIGGNDFEIDFNLDYKILHDAGYNVLTYDLRNLGLSGTANGGITSGGIFESRDVIGSLDYVRGHSSLQKMTVALFSRCLGCNATIFAMDRRPERFEGIRCMVGVQPLSPHMVMRRILALNNIPLERMEEVARGIKLATSLELASMSPIEPAKAVMVPTLLYQVRDDLLTEPSDVQAVFDNIPCEEKELMWIEGSTRRWDGYAYFGREPARILDWFAKFM